MSVRVGRVIKRKWLDVDGYQPILVTTKSASKWFSLSPYSLKTKQGYIMENVWQGLKVYADVPASTQYYSQWDRTVIWKHPAEHHYDTSTNKLTQEYYNWRMKCISNAYPVRYPVGFKYRHKCLFALKNPDPEDPYTVKEEQKLNYIESRKQIYVPLYEYLVKQELQFKELQDKLQRGENLLILDVDGPHQESLNYYQEKYGVDDDFIINQSILANPENLSIFLNDTKHPYGHGYVLASALLNFNVS